jgi:hypothetical protein
MRTKLLLIACIACLTIMFAASPSPASITLGGITFDDNAFADQLVSSSGNWSYNGVSLEASLVGSDLNTYAVALYSSENVVMKFTDNFIKNGPGADLAVFEIGSTSGTGEPVAITINGITHTYTTYWVVADASVAQINLDDFNISAGGLVSTLMASGITGWNVDYAVFGAMNSVSSAVPIPGAVWLLGSGLLGLGGWRRFRKS